MHISIFHTSVIDLLLLYFLTLLSIIALLENQLKLFHLFSIQIASYIPLLFEAHCRSTNFLFDKKYRNICSTAEKNIIFALTISATPLYNAYQGGTYFLYTYGNIY